MTRPPDAQRKLYLAEIVKHALALREALVRHDENLAAQRLLDALPSWLLDGDFDGQLGRAIHDQRQMVLHLLDPAEYARYYATNPHERPFEDQYGIPVENANMLPRVRWLTEQLQEFTTAPYGDLSIPEAQDKTDPISIADLGCNDGWMLAYLKDHADPPIRGEKVGVDLNPDCVARARDRGIKAVIGAAEDAPEILRNDHRLPARFDAVILFEVIEHVLDPDQLLAAAAWILRPDGRLYVSCPNGAIEQGWLPNWNQVERKGHVRTLNPAQLRELIQRAGLEPLSAPMFPDGTMAIEARKP